ncbi:hypothetical protein [Cognatiyoonia sp.]|uniref:hypothetical protein n=1 Tax=Cognatiyoonia sp. TaxID=2211652 RepID=UPI003F69DF3D
MQQDVPNLEEQASEFLNWGQMLLGEGQELGALLFRPRDAFAENDISIPFPQREVRMPSGKKGDAG